MDEFFPLPLAERHFEDYPVGLVAAYGPAIVTQESIVRFATEFDPHAMHVDADAAADGPFGGIIASGWHTTSIMMRLMVDNYLNERTSLGSPGVDALRFLVPVRPGDELTARFEVASARRSASRPDRGILHTNIELRNQSGDLVMTQTMINLVRARNPQA